MNYSYLAGIIDGEGYLGITKQSRKDRPSISYREILQVANTYKDLVDFLKNEIGGSVYIIKRPQDKDYWKVQYVWHCSQSEIEFILKKTMPYLIVKKGQAKLLLEFIKYKKSFKRKSLGQGLGSSPLSLEEINFRENIWLKVKSLNKKGR
jgi:hypothetical protein